MSVSSGLLGIVRSPQTDSTAVLDNGTFRDSVFYNLLGEDFVRLAVSPTCLWLPRPLLMF